MVAAAYAVLFLGLGFLSRSRPSVEAIVVGLVTGAGFALVLMPLARRLPYGTPTRIIALFIPLYWINSLSNLVEAYFITSIPHVQLVFGGVFLVIPALVVSFVVAWLVPAISPDAQPVPMWELLRRRSLRSWVWRILAAALLFALCIELFGLAWGPLISRYYHDPAYIAQAHIASPLPPAYVTWTEEFVRGVIFVLALLPVLAVMRGRSRRSIVGIAAYIALLNATLEAWLPMLGGTFPLGFRLGEGLDLTSDAVARGIFVAALLALPAVGSEQTMPFFPQWHPSLESVRTEHRQ